MEYRTQRFTSVHVIKARKALASADQKGCPVHIETEIRKGERREQCAAVKLTNGNIRNAVRREGIRRVRRMPEINVAYCGG